MKTVLYNDPLCREFYDRLRYLYLYADDVVVIDYSTLIGDLHETISDPGFLNEIVDNAIRDSGQQRPGLDRERRVKAHARLKASITNEYKPIANSIERVLCRYREHYDYLRELQSRGVLRVQDDIFSADVKMRKDAASGVLYIQDDGRRTNFDNQTLENFSQVIYSQGILPYLEKDSHNSAFSSISILLAVTLANVYGVASIFAKSVNETVYVGHDSHQRLVNTLAQAPSSIGPYLSESVFRIEAPIIPAVNFEVLENVKRRTVEARSAYQYELESLTTHLESRPWDEDLLEEIRIVRRQKIEPVIRNLQLSYRSALKYEFPTMSNAAVSNTVTSAVLSIGAGWQMDSTVKAVSLGVLTFFFGQVVQNVLNTRKEVKKSNLGYVLEVSKVIGS